MLAQVAFAGASLLATPDATRSPASWLLQQLHGSGVASRILPRRFRGAVMDLLAALLLGIIEGITEFLPISSTGHLLIAEHWLGRRSDLFNIAIQAGAILAVVLIYRVRLWQLAVGFMQPANRDYLYKLGGAFLITVAGGFTAKLLGLALPETVAPVAWALIVGG